MKSLRGFSGLAILAAAILAASGGIAERALGACGPFTDVAADAFCPLVLEIFTLAITTGTTATTYDPGANVSRLQMAAFLSRTVDGVLKRGSKRAAMRQFWTLQATDPVPSTTLGQQPGLIEFDGADLWVGEPIAGQLARIRPSDGRLLETWTGVSGAEGIAVAMGKVFTVGLGDIVPSKLWRVDPAAAAGAATAVATNLPDLAFGLAFDGGRLWTSNQDGTVSIVTPGASLPWTVTTTAGGYQSPSGILFDGSNIWITDIRTLKKLNSSGGVLQTVTVGLDTTGTLAFLPVFDGSNIWVPIFGNPSQLSVVRASNGAVLANLTGNGLNHPAQAAFDGRRILVTNESGGSVSLWKAADLTPLGSYPLPPNAAPLGATSDGVNFWIAAPINSGASLSASSGFRGTAGRRTALAASLLAAAGLGASSVLLGTCGPFTDVPADAFCSFVVEIFTIGITTGTTPTTFDPASNVSRLQMAAFLSRTVDRALQRGGPRAALGRFYTPQGGLDVGITTLSSPQMVETDGEDLWVTNSNDATVSRVHGDDGRLLETWTGASIPFAVTVALGRVLVTGFTSPGQLYRIDPAQAAGAVTVVASTLGDKPQGIAFDGLLFWTANFNGTVSRITPNSGAFWPVVTTPGFGSVMGVLYDGANIWVTDHSAGTLLKLDGTAGVLQTVTLGGNPAYPVFDGTNIWVPNQGAPNSVEVVRASSGAVLATLTGNGMNSPIQAAFDGQRILVTSKFGGASLWKAADMTVIGSFPTGPLLPFPFGSCSDGESFWIANVNGPTLARF